MLTNIEKAPAGQSLTGAEKKNSGTVNLPRRRGAR